MEDIIHRTKSTLKNQIKELNSIIVTEAFDLELCSSDFRYDKEITALCKKIGNKKGSVIYIISVSSKKIKNQLVSNYLTFHESNKKKIRSEDRYNTSKYNGGDSLTLYVGSSKDIKSRIEKHLGKGTIRTYALKINKWDDSLVYSLKIKVLSVQATNHTPVSQNIIELIEQEVWKIHQPVFGKKSGR